MKFEFHIKITYSYGDLLIINLIYQNDNKNNQNIKRLCPVFILF
jgi:hypothetical protein